MPETSTNIFLCLLNSERRCFMKWSWAITRNLLFFKCLWKLAFYLLKFMIVIDNQKWGPQRPKKHCVCSNTWLLWMCYQEGHGCRTREWISCCWKENLWTDKSTRGNVYWACDLGKLNNLLNFMEMFSCLLHLITYPWYLVTENCRPLFSYKVMFQFKFKYGFLIQWR